MLVRFFIFLLFSFYLCGFSPDASAMDQSLDTGNTAWVLTSTALVLFMTLPGVALFYAGLVQSKNVLSVMMQCFAIACVVSLVWFIFGYTLKSTDFKRERSSLSGPNGNNMPLPCFRCLPITAISILRANL